MNRSQRCGQCRGCTAKPCGRCIYCQDSPQFGGPGVKKQSCIERRCLKVLENRLQRDGPTFKAKVGCNNCDECMTPDCHTCLICLDKKFFKNNYLPGAMCAKKRCNQARSLDLSYLSQQQTQTQTQIGRQSQQPPMNGHPQSSQMSNDVSNQAQSCQQRMGDGVYGPVFHTSAQTSSNCLPSGQKRQSPNNQDANDHQGSNGTRGGGGPRKKKSNGSASTPSNHPITISHQPILPGPPPSHHAQQSQALLQPHLSQHMNNQPTTIIAAQLSTPSTNIAQFRIPAGNGQQQQGSQHTQQQQQQQHQQQQQQQQHQHSGVQQPTLQPSLQSMSQVNVTSAASNTYVAYNFPTVPIVPVNLLEISSPVQHPQQQQQQLHNQSGGILSSSVGGLPYFTTATLQPVKVLPDPNGIVTAISSSTVVPSVSATPIMMGQLNGGQNGQNGNNNRQQQQHQQVNYHQQPYSQQQQNFNGNNGIILTTNHSINQQQTNVTGMGTGFIEMNGMNGEAHQNYQQPNMMNGLFIPQTNGNCKSSEYNVSSKPTLLSYSPTLEPPSIKTQSSHVSVTNLSPSYWHQYGLASSNFDNFATDPSTLIPPSLSGSQQVVLQPL